MLAYELPRFSIAGALEPRVRHRRGHLRLRVNAQQLTVSITDADGNGLRAAMLSSLPVSALRNARRCGFPILDQARTANRHLSEQFARAEFVTGLLLGSRSRTSLSRCVGSDAATEPRAGGYPSVAPHHRPRASTTTDSATGTRHWSPTNLGSGPSPHRDLRDPST